MYEIRDIVLLKPEYGNNKQIVIIGFNPNRPKNIYRGRNLAGRGSRVSILSDDIIVTKVGQVEENHPLLKESEPEEVYVSPHGSSPTDTYVRSLKHGDPISIKNSRTGRVEPWTFKKYLTRGSKFKFAAVNSEGKSFKIQLVAVEMPAKPWQ